MIDIKINNTVYKLPVLTADMDEKQVDAFRRHLLDLRSGSGAEESGGGRKKRAKEKGGVGKEGEKKAGRDKAVRELLRMLAGIEKEVAENIEPESLDVLYKDYLSPLAEQIQPRTERSFNINGEELLFPEWGKDINGENIPLYTTTAIEFCEASDLMLADENRYATLIAAILCRPTGKAYDEKTALRNASEMDGLAETVKGRVTAELKLAHRYMKRFFPQVYLRNPGWNDLLFHVGRFMPSEIKTAGEMDCYSFMKLAHSRIKSKS